MNLVFFIIFIINEKYSVFFTNAITMASPSIIFYVFMLCAILFTIECRPSKSSSSSTAVGNQRPDQNDENQLEEQTSKKKGNIKIPFGNDILIRGKPKTKNMDMAIVSTILF